MALTAVPMAAQASVQCAPTAAVLDYLRGHYAEHPMRWKETDTGLIVITANKDRTSWTALRIFGEEMACRFTSGTDWPAVEAEAVSIDGLPL